MRHTALVGLALLLPLQAVAAAGQDTDRANDAAESPATPQRFTVAGLEAPAEILVDHWGVPHIYANTHYDAFVAQGFNAARDRLWQIDLWRRRGLGELSAVFGPAFVEQDRAARLFLYRGDMYSEWLAYGSDAKAIAQAFTAGINAYVDWASADPARLPPEFRLLDYRPAHWQPEDLVRIRSHGLAQNVVSEVRRARIVCELGLDAAAAWKVLQPAWQTRVPEGLDPCSVPEDVLRSYLLARSPVDPSRLGQQAASDPGRQAAWLAQTERALLTRGLGSNNWAVAPDYTATGRPILANDPHRTQQVPSLRYIAHLVAPELNVIGAGEPSLPGISIGHNERIAFGLTVFYIDQEDLYRYRARRSGYVYGGRTEPLEVVEDVIPVRGQTPQRVQLEFTRHGPVIWRDQEQIFAVRAAWLLPGMAPYFGSVEYMRASNWREFSAALNRWGAPSENQVYADIDGNIGYKPAGRFPRRRNWDGLLPVPGDGRYEWDGFWDMDALPSEFNPERGFVGTANAMNLPPDYPIERRRVGFEWSAPWRYRRLWEALSADIISTQPHDLIDSHSLQRDYKSLLARAVITRLPRPEELAGDPVAEPLALLKDWDLVMTTDSAAAALWAVWYYRHLNPAMAAALAPERPELVAPLDGLTVSERLDAAAGRRLALATLAQAWLETRELLGPDVASWHWGDLHRIRFEHPLLHRARGELAQRMRLPDYPRGGSGETLNDTGFSPEDFAVRSGASFRMVLDVGRWDDAEMTNAPGQSGDPASPFYSNLLEGWARDSGFPLLYTREAIEANQALRIELRPASASEPAP